MLSPLTASTRDFWLLITKFTPIIRVEGSIERNPKNLHSLVSSKKRGNGLSSHVRLHYTGVELLMIARAFDDKLMFNVHVKQVMCKARPSPNFIKRWVKNFDCPYVRAGAYTSLVKPSVESFIRSSN